MTDHNKALRALLGRAPVIPVLTFETPEEAIDVSGALVAGGLDVLEVTLRTPRALEIIDALAKAFPDAWVGAGTVLRIAQAEAAHRAGARFLVSPGSTDALLRDGVNFPLPWLHAAVTASEVMRLRELGRRVLKFFPAEQAGGVAVLKAWAPVLQDVTFCPTGGIDAVKAPAYLALPNVGAVGGSWVVPADAVAKRDLARITELARAAAALRAK
jgi:2-dehydro-3-deoxyphosphogluconate aldolase/(4S)-4-hydroxy-2-oxoglutarate aldolase